ncbi:hypothetical protein DRN72_01590 [Methanosarcinales archaeon]|nr:MAG: hypothetical protein DRN72_01590 [Methanosarcinales archaeon]
MEIALNILSKDKMGLLRDVASIVFEEGGNIKYTQQFIIERGRNVGKANIYMEIEGIENAKELVQKIRELDAVEDVTLHDPFNKIFGGRVIVIGGGAQVAQVAMGAVNEADRHNIRGERISVDTIPLVGEEEIAKAVSAVSRLHRAQVLVLAGSLMGGRISEEVDKLREAGIPVISLNMAGSIPEHADLVVTDPIQAGTFAVMHIAKTAKFNIEKVRGKRF